MFGVGASQRLPTPHKTICCIGAKHLQGPPRGSGYPGAEPHPVLQHCSGRAGSCFLQFNQGIRIFRSCRLLSMETIPASPTARHRCHCCGAFPFPEGRDILCPQGHGPKGAGHFLSPRAATLRPTRLCMDHGSLQCSSTFFPASDPSPGTPSATGDAFAPRCSQRGMEEWEEGKDDLQKGMSGRRELRCSQHSIPNPHFSRHRRRAQNKAQGKGLFPKENSPVPRRRLRTAAVGAGTEQRTPHSRENPTPSPAFRKVLPVSDVHPGPPRSRGPLGQGRRAPVQSVQVGNSRGRKLSALKPHGLGAHRENVPRPGFLRDMGRLVPLAGRGNTGGVLGGCQGDARGMPGHSRGMQEDARGMRGIPWGYRGAPSYLSCPRRSVPARRGAGCGPG